MLSIDKARELAESTLSQKRFHHTQCVAAGARELAERFGCDPEEAELAGWLHDIMKERPEADLLQMIKASGIINFDAPERCPALRHAWAGGIYARQELGLPGSIADAITYHTTGREGMSALEKVVYLADYISADRDFPGVDEVRSLARKSLGRALFAALQNQIQHLAGSGRYIDGNSVAAYNDLLEKR